MPSPYDRIFENSYPTSRESSPGSSDESMNEKLPGGSLMGSGSLILDRDSLGDAS
jgi:hypothetical protein